MRSAVILLAHDVADVVQAVGPLFRAHLRIEDAKRPCQGRIGEREKCDGWVGGRAADWSSRADDVAFGVDPSGYSS